MAATEAPPEARISQGRAAGMGFLKYEPPGYAERQERWPLLLFLHGAGESGDDPQELLSEGATGCPLVELQKGTAVPVLRDSFVVVAPQTNVGWDAERISAFTDAIASDESQFRIDPSRMYCTGVSMGGYGAWQAGTLGGKFAAIAPVCGAGGVSAASLGSTPVWAFHGANDVVVPVHATDGMVQRLRALRFGGNANAAEGEGAGGIGGGGRGRGGRRDGPPNEVKYTRYDESPAPTGWESYDGHASWKQAYGGPELFDWLLAHSKTT